MANFEAFLKSTKLSINLLFLKSEYTYVEGMLKSLVAKRVLPGLRLKALTPE